MKKLALLFGALSLVSSVAYAKEVVPVVEEVVVIEEAAPVVAAESALKVVAIGQELTVENTSGQENGDIGDTSLDTSVELAYGDWAFGVTGSKTWAVDTDTDHAKTVSDSSSVEFTATRGFENGFVGGLVELANDSDKYAINGGYEFDMFSGEAELSYTSNNGSRDGFVINEEGDKEWAEGDKDAWELEMTPVAFTYNDITLAYYVDINKTVNDAKVKNEVAQQVRLSAPLFAGEKLAVSAEYRYQFDEKKNFKSDVKDDSYQENNMHVAILGAEYAVNDALTIGAAYEYDFNKYKLHNGAEGQKADHDDYYGEFSVNWTYSF